MTTDSLRGSRVLLVDDHDVMRAGLALLLHEILGVIVAEASDAVTARSMLETSTFDLVLLDVRLGSERGVDLLRQLRADGIETPVLMLSTYDGPDDVEPALDAGAGGYVLKEATPDQLAEAMTTTIDGRGVYLSPRVAERLLARRQAAEHSVAATLTERELQILELLTDGATNVEIGEAMVVSTKTVKTHLSALFRKLGVSNRTQAASMALREGMVTHRGDS